MLRRILTVLTGFLFVISFSAFSQQRFRGKILSKTDKTPIPYASLVTKGTKSIGSMADASGNFEFVYTGKIKSTDSLVVSAIGHHPVRMSLTDVRNTRELFLELNPNMLENVIVVSTLRGNASEFGYFRSWRELNNTGEIGQLVLLPSRQVQIGSVQVKIQKNYDTCWLRLHLRDVAPGGLPEDELLAKEVIVPVTGNGLVEFDLNWKPIKLPFKVRKKEKAWRSLNKIKKYENRLYVGFELIKCSSCSSENPSFLFVGSEEGENYFRDRKDGEWQVSDNYTIYIRLFLK